MNSIELAFRWNDDQPFHCFTLTPSIFLFSPHRLSKTEAELTMSEQRSRDLLWNARTITRGKCSPGYNTSKGTTTGKRGMSKVNGTCIYSQTNKACHKRPLVKPVTNTPNMLLLFSGCRYIYIYFFFNWYQHDLRW